MLIILADDLGFSDLGCYGGEIETPNLDSLAENGIRFTQFYNMARCWPTRAGVLTGYYAHQVRRDTLPGVPSGGRGKRPAWARLLPDMLRPLGYRSYHSGKWHNTLIFFLSDNGASAEIMVRGDGHDPTALPGSAATHLCLGPGWSTTSNTPMRRHKTWVHEGGISTPLIVHWPKGIAARNELRHTPGHVIDLVPTILAVAGGRRLDTWQGKPVPAAPGKNLVSVFAADCAPRRECLWWLHEDNRAVRVGDWKLVSAGNGVRWELFDLSADRTETNDLAAEHPDKVRELERVWRRHFEEFRKLASKDLPGGG